MQEGSGGCIVDSDGRMKLIMQCAGVLRGVYAVRSNGEIIDDALFDLTVSRNGVEIGTASGIHVKSFPLRCTVMWEIGDTVMMQFNPAVVAKGTQVSLRFNVRSNAYSHIATQRMGIS